MAVIISVDAGRSAIKGCNYNSKTKIYTKGMFSSKHGIIEWEHLKSIPVMTFDSTDRTVSLNKCENEIKIGDILVSIDSGKNYIMGKTTDILLPQEQIIYATNDEVYLEYATSYILTMIAKLCENNDEIMLVINLTFSNFKAKDDLKEKLKGKHTINFYTPKSKIVGSKTFTVIQLTVLYQGWSSLIYKYLDVNLNKDKKYEKDGLVIDIGRKTTDLCFNRKLNLVKGKSIDIGMENVFDNIKKDVFNKYNTKKNTMDIEEAINSGNKIMTKKGEEVDPTTLLTNAVFKVANIINKDIMELCGEDAPYYTVLTGGGAIYFQDYIKQLYPNLDVIEDSQFSNAIGMCRLAVENTMG